MILIKQPVWACPTPRKFDYELCWRMHKYHYSGTCGGCGSQTVRYYRERLKPAEAETSAGSLVASDSEHEGPASPIIADRRVE